MDIPTYAIDDQTAIKVIDGVVEVVSEGHWKRFTHEYSQAASLITLSEPLPWINFPEGGTFATLRLVGARTTTSGVVIATYQPA